VTGLIALPHKTDLEECVFRNIRRPGQASLEVYKKGGGYREAEIEAVLLDVKESGLGGDFGARCEAADSVVCRVREKDRVLLHYDPHAVMEGLMLIGRAMGRDEAVLVTDGSLPEAPLGGFTIRVEADAGDALGDAELFAAVSHITQKSAAWYRGLGFGRHNGTKIFTIEGEVERPGQYELRLGIQVARLLEYAGSPTRPVTIDGVTVGPEATLAWELGIGEGLVRV